MTMREERSIFYSLFKHPKVFNLILKFFSDHEIVGQIVKEELELEGKERILDLGCGTGNLSRFFPSASYTGVDPNESYIDFARNKYNNNFLTMDGSHLEFDNNYFDLVFVKDVFHHISDDIFLKILSEIKRVLKPTGEVLIIEISYKLSDEPLYKKIIRKLDRGEYIREFNILQRDIRAFFNIDKAYIKKTMWADLSVFVLNKEK